MFKVCVCIIWVDKVLVFWINCSIIIFYCFNGYFLNCLILKVFESFERDWSDMKYILNYL